MFKYELEKVQLSSFKVVGRKAYSVMAMFKRPKEQTVLTELKREEKRGSQTV